MNSKSENYNFSAGPAMLPQAVMKEIQAQLMDGLDGFSVLELSHRSKPILEIRDQLEASMRDLLKIPDDFAFLMMHGGARGQFSALPLNLLSKKSSPVYLLTGLWGELAAKAAQSYAKVETLPIYQDVDQFNRPYDLPNAGYLHYTDNETVHGVEFKKTPQVKNAHVVSDMTSSILSKPLDWSRLDCVYAGAQKNLGIAGCTYVIIRRALLGHAHALTPDILNYETLDKSSSMLNTPPVFAWYVTHKLLNWVKAQGGVQEMANRASRRAAKLYDFIDQSAFYENTVPTPIRSRLNIPFQISRNESQFFEEAKAYGLYYLEGHRHVGGARASLYNAMPESGVDKLIQFMETFAKKNT